MKPCEVPQRSVKIKINPYLPNPRQRKEIELNFYFHTSLWCLKRFYEGLKGLKPFEAPQRSVKMKIKLNFYFNTTFRNALDGKG